MPNKPSLVLCVFLGAGLVAGCGSDRVTMYEPGVYKGKQDAAASEEAAERRAGDLRSRAERGLTDR